MWLILSALFDLFISSASHVGAASPFPHLLLGWSWNLRDFLMHVSLTFCSVSLLSELLICLIACLLSALV